MESIGKAIEIEAGKTYVIETDTNLPDEAYKRYQEIFTEQTGAKAVFLCNGKIARHREQDIRDQIADEIEAMRLTLGHDTNVGSSENCSRIACIVCKQVQRAAAIARGDK